jgi:superfamily II DNA/RNA helicase
VDIEVSGNRIPTDLPISSFEKMGLDETVLKNITKRAGFSHPTPVQTWAIPIVMQKRDIMVQAQTGIFQITRSSFF